MFDSVTGNYIHPYWDQTSAATGRLASANPNVQSVPKQVVNIQIDSPIHGMLFLFIQLNLYELPCT